MQLLKPIAEVLGSVEVEAERKVSSSLQSAAFSKRSFVELSKKVFEKDDLRASARALDFAESLPAMDPNHPSMKAYFAHPVRVATFVLRLSTPSVETTTMALLHNVFEVSGLEEQALLNAGFSPRTASGIRLLTIDRSRQFDVEYLTEFCGNIEEFGSDLSLIKCVDRLDNLLGFDLVRRDSLIQTYLDLSNQFVVPMASRLSPDFGDYLANVIRHFQTRNCNEETRRRYESFLEQATDDEPLNSDINSVTKAG